MARRKRMTAEERDRRRRMKWWHEAKFGMFIHWGLYSVLGRHEWAMEIEGIPVAEYEGLADEFKPKRGFAETWAKLAKQAGMKYMVLTSKHHDGFCLFDTEFTDYCAPKQAAGRDLCAEYVEAARAEGTKEELDEKNREIEELTARLTEATEREAARKREEERASKREQARREMAAFALDQARALYREAQFDEARGWLKRALEQDPTNVEARQLLARLGDTLGDRERLIRDVLDILVTRHRDRKAAKCFFRKVLKHQGRPPLHSSPTSCAAIRRRIGRSSHPSHIEPGSTRTTELKSPTSTPGSRNAKCVASNHRHKFNDFSRSTGRFTTCSEWDVIISRRTSIASSGKTWP